MSSIDPEEEDHTSTSLELTSLDADSLFSALTAVDQAIPNLLLSIKPILTHLIAPISTADQEAAGIAARTSVEHYMTLLDKIQFVLRQTVYYLRETKASSSTLNPPPADAIPTPFGTSLPRDDARGRGSEPDLGLYGSRIEARTLREMTGALRELRQQQQQVGVVESADSDRRSVDEKIEVNTAEAR
ncbi:MAG: hypothetical protein TREMPRED_004688 [Tremellales sp. Tagirdzhanova-0007]|nr:MAG: hypothetical protein TREMPRED_004688 [Tremellales sp. Tagirdzhanova-0007]